MAAARDLAGTLSGSRATLSPADSLGYPGGVLITIQPSTSTRDLEDYGLYVQEMARRAAVRYGVRVGHPDPGEFRFRVVFYRDLTGTAGLLKYRCAC